MRQPLLALSAIWLRHSLRNKVEYTSLPAYLMPAEFTLPDLQRVYENRRLILRYLARSLRAKISQGVTREMA